MPADDAFKAYRYTMLVSSLPHLPPPYTYQHLPITRVQLEQRLALLTREDRHLVDVLERLLVPQRLGHFADDNTLISQANALLTALPAQCQAHVWLQWWLTLNGLGAALALRQRGGDTPGALSALPGVGRQLARAWSHPDFHLAHRYPYLERLAEAVASGRADTMERGLIDIAWAYFHRERAVNPCGLEAIMLYLYRWWLLSRAAPRDPDIARERFLRWVDTLPARDPFTDHEATAP